MENIVHIFIDEYGTPDLELPKEGNEPFFIYAAVIIEDKNIQKAREIHRKIVDKYYQKTFIKSQHITNDNKNGFNKIVNTITELKELEYHVEMLIVDKSKIDNDSGLSYKRSFIKYFQSLLSENFRQNFASFHIHFDKTGRYEFQESLKEYMYSKGGLQQNLFYCDVFDLQDDRVEEPLIQLADFYAGCVGKYLCGKIDENRTKTINDLVKSKLFITFFPKESISYIVATNQMKSEFDTNLFSLAINTAYEYLERHYDDELGCEIIRLLLQENRLNPFRHISSKELKQKLLQKGIPIGDPINEISRLREKGVLIISPLGKKGYKFPNNEKEIAEFFNRLSCNVLPQLKRGYVFNHTLVEKSVGKYNILENTNFVLLKTLVDEVNKQNLLNL